MFLGYNTNGFAHHDLLDAVDLLADLGYRGIAITIDHGVLLPRDAIAKTQIEELRKKLEKYGMRSVIETGARFLLDPRCKHEPTLLSADPRPRIEFYKYAIQCAKLLGSDCASIWSGAIRDGIGREEAFERLAARLPEILDFAAENHVSLAFEPEPGMLIDSTAAFERLAERIERPDLPVPCPRSSWACGDASQPQHAHGKRGHGTEKIERPDLLLTLDIGHLQCQGETPIAEVIRRYAPRLANVHLEDMRRDVHEHLMFGEGEIDFPPVLQALAQFGYTNGLYVELSRHSHAAPEAAKKAMEFLKKLGLGS